MRSRILCPALVLALLGVLNVLPLTAQAPVSSAEGTDWAAFLGDFPAAGSGAVHDDLAVLLWLQHTRTQDEVARAKSELSLQVEIFSAVTGVDLDSSPFARTRALLEAAGGELRGVTSNLKRHFARPRPYKADARILPALHLEPSFSYPSGHAAWGAVTSAVLAQLDPGRGEAILERGRQVGYDRVLGGVHYPSDVEAGQRLGLAMAALWMQDSAHRRQLEEVRAKEWGTSAGAPRR